MSRYAIIPIVAVCCILSSFQCLAQLEESFADGSFRLARQWPGPDGKPLPFETLAQMFDFLKTAKITELGRTETGVTGARKVLLEMSDIKMHGIFRDVDIYKQEMDFGGGKTELRFQDKAIFECAAFELSRLLGFRFVPPAVPRIVQGKEGSLQPWIEKAVMEKDVVEKKIEIPDRWLKAMQQQVMFVFDNLIYNVDRNQGNILFLEDWKMVLIDHTRSFRLHKSLLNPDSIKFCERGLYDGLKGLDRQSLDERLGPYLTPGQIDAILVRRDLLVQHIDSLIERNGEKAVLFRFFRVETE